MRTVAVCVFLCSTLRSPALIAGRPLTQGASMVQVTRDLAAHRLPERSTQFLITAAATLWATGVPLRRRRNIG